MNYGRIFLVFSDTGAGHRSAAEAIKRAIIELSSKQGDTPPEIVLQDIIEESHVVNRLFTHMYNRLLREHQDWMKYYIALIEWVKPNESELGYQLCKAYATKLIEEVNPAVIVSVHPMVNHFLARTLKELGLTGKIKLITVLTDPNSHLWTGWACAHADLTIAPNDLARDRLISFGMDASTIKVIGMPIEPEFLKAPTKPRETMLGKLGLDPNMFTVALTAGSAGGGNMLQIYRAMKNLKKPIQIIFVCGKNKKLMEQLKIEQLTIPWKTFIMPYADEVSDGMNACDLLVTKAGGLTTFEAIARRLPMAIDMLTEPMPQEIGTAEMLIEAGLAKPIRQADDIVPIVEALEVIPDRLNMPLPAVHNLDHVDAVYEIAQIILKLCEPVNREPDPEVKSERSAVAGFSKVESK